MSLDEQNERVFLLNEEQMVATRWLRINEILGPRRSFEFCLEWRSEGLKKPHVPSNCYRAYYVSNIASLDFTLILQEIESFWFWDIYLSGNGYISHLGKRKTIIFKSALAGDMLVPWRVGNSSINSIYLGTTPDPGCQAPLGLRTIFSRETQPKPLFVTGWVGGRTNVYLYPEAKGTSCDMPSRQFLKWIRGFYTNCDDSSGQITATSTRPGPPKASKLEGKST